MFILRVIGLDWTVKYRHLLSVPWKISTKAINRIDHCSSLCWLEGWEGQLLQYNSAGGDLVSGALILKSLNNRDSLWTGLWWTDISDKIAQAEQIKVRWVTARLRITFKLCSQTSTHSVESWLLFLHRISSSVSQWTIHYAVRFPQLAPHTLTFPYTLIKGRLCVVCFPACTLFVKCWTHPPADSAD